MTKKRNETKELQEKVQDLENQLKRAVADYQNLEKRVIEERRELIRSANKDLLLRLLPALDTLILASKHVEDQGLKLSIQHFLDILKQEGVEKIETKDKIFDPRLMEAIDKGKGEEEKIMDELKSGYTLHGNVLRPAQVKVAEEWVVENEKDTYKLEPVQGISNPPDAVRKLYRVIKNESNDQFIYKGVSISRSRESVDRNKGMSLGKIFEKGENYIENDLISGNDDNREIILNSNREFWIKLGKDGEQLEEVLYQ